MMRLHWTFDSIKQPIGFRITAFHVEIPTVGWYSWMIRSVCWYIQGETYLTIVAVISNATSQKTLPRNDCPATTIAVNSKAKNQTAAKSWQDAGLSYSGFHAAKRSRNGRKKYGRHAGSV